jgi:ATP-dependent protease HslVU (ClpYQ) peptidase subunit
MLERSGNVKSFLRDHPKNLPFRQRPKPYIVPRIGAGRAMTICVAAINGSGDDCSIITASDRRISFGDFFSREDAIKFRPVHKNWIAMFAGDVEETMLMLRSVSEALKTIPSNTHSDVVDCCRKTYMLQRKRLIEIRILPNYDIETYEEYTALQKSDEAMFLKIQDDVSKADENDWKLLFAGFDDQATPHIFVVSGPGTVQHHDFQKIAAIGSGETLATTWLNFCSYKISMSLGKAIFAVLSAKIFAERGSWVGEKTIVTVSRPKGFALMLEDNFAEARTAWKSLPKIDDAAAKSLEDLVRGHFDARKTQ